MDNFKNISDLLEDKTNSNIVSRIEEGNIPDDFLKITNNKDYINFLYTTGMKLFSESHYESAIRFFEKILTYKNDFPVERTIRIYNNLMRCYAEEGPVEAVDRVFKKISYLDFVKIPLDQVFVSFYELAYSYYKRDEFQTAIMIVDNAIKGYDDGGVSKIKNLQKACVDIICKLLLLKTNILFSLNNYSECKKYIEFIESIDTEKKLYTYVMFYKGRTSAEQGKILDALINYRRAINFEQFHCIEKQGPIGVQIYLHLSRMFYQIGKYGSSKKYFYKYLMKTRSGRSALSNMLISELIALYSFQEGDFREADSIFTKLLGSTVTYKTKEISFLTKLGLFNLHLASDGLEDAKITLDTTYRFLQSTVDNVNRRKLEIEWAKFFIAKGMTSKAIEVAQNAIPYFIEKERNGDLAKLYGILARSYIIKKEYIEALKIISKQEKIAARNFLKIDYLESKFYKIIAYKSLRKNHLLEKELAVARKLISQKVGGVVYMVIFSKIQGYIQDHSVFLRKNQENLVKIFLKGLGTFGQEEDDKDIILDYKRKTIYEKTLGEVYMGNKGLLLRLLLTLIEKRGKVVSKEELFETVWKDLYNPLKHDNLIYININRLRKLIEPDIKKNCYILNTAGGYMFNDAATFLIKSVNMEESLSKRQSDILDYIRKDKQVTIKEYKEKFGISKSSAIRDLKRLKTLKLITEQRVGNRSVFATRDLQA